MHMAVGGRAFMKISMRAALRLLLLLMMMCCYCCTQLQNTKCV